MLNLKFKINEKADSLNAIYFIKNSKSNKQFLKWFFPKKIQYILGKNFSDKERKKIIITYTTRVYKTEKNQIKEGIKIVIENWNDVENLFFKLTDKIFQNHKWPKGDYIGFATIYDMYPRNISKKTFFFPYTHKIPKYAIYVIAHELLHFIFFDYIKKIYNLNEDSELPNKSKRYLWQISEVFNNVIEDWKPFRLIFKIQTQPYPGTERIFKVMKNQWREKQDIRYVLDRWLK